MKRHIQEVGIRKWAGQDLVELQSETFRAIDGFFAQYGPCVIQGCEITPNGSVWDVAPGLVVLEGKDYGKRPVTMVVPFAGASGVSLPLYLTLTYAVQERVYGDGKVKPVACDYRAAASTVAPEEEIPCLVLDSGSVPRFVDVLQDSDHRFLTDTERLIWSAKETPAAAQEKADGALAAAKTYADDLGRTASEALSAHAGDSVRHLTAAERTAWNAKETPEGAQEKAGRALSDASTYSDATEAPHRSDVMNTCSVTLTDAKAYTDGRETAVRSDMLPKDFSYGVVDPNGIFTNGGSYANSNVPASFAHVFSMKSYGLGAMQLAAEMLGTNRFWMRANYSEVDGRWNAWNELWHSGNFDPAGKADTGHNHDGAYVPAGASCNKNWYWVGQEGQPSWLWGGNDGRNMYIYNPSNFSVSHAASAGTAATATNAGNADTLDGQHASAFAAADHVHSGYQPAGSYAAASHSHTYDNISSPRIVGTAHGTATGGKVFTKGKVSNIYKNGDLYNITYLSCSNPVVIITPFVNGTIRKLVVNITSLTVTSCSFYIADGSNSVPLSAAFVATLIE